MSDVENRGRLMSGAPIRVLVADDHTEVRRLLIRLIGRAGDMTVVGEACDGHEVLERLACTPADVVLLDLTMPRKGGIETLRDLLPRHPSVRVLIVSMHPAEQLARRMIRAGARGYLGKDCVAECLHHAIRTVYDGGIWLVDGELAVAPRAASLAAERLPPLHVA
jgi:DNA-binding NarL/FixJ family response regulator